MTSRVFVASLFHHDLGARHVALDDRSCVIPWTGDTVEAHGELVLLEFASARASPGSRAPRCA
jgi:hypothetical protein